MLPHPLTNFEIQKYYQNKSKLKGVYSWNNLPSTMKDGGYIVNLDKCKSMGTYRIVLYANGNSVTYCDSFGVEYIPQEIKRFIGKKM